MQRIAAALAVLLASASPGSGARPEPPVVAIQEFLAAVKKRDCARAWKYLSTASREYIECKSKEMIKSAPYNSETFSPSNLYCLPTSVHRYHSYQPATAWLKALSQGRATVSVERHDPEGFRLPGFFPTKSKIVPVEMVVTEEGGRWRIDVPTSASGPLSSCPAMRLLPSGD